MNPYLGMIFPFAGNFAINGFQMCNGQLLSISQNTALFSVVGTFYGGDGTSTFALPDLRGRGIKHQGEGVGLASYTVGQSGGIEYQTLTVNQIPAHSHALNVNNAAGNTATPGATTFLAGGVPTGSGPNASQLMSYTTTVNNVSLNPASIGSTGGTQPFSILQPYLTVTYLIAMTGIFPSRN
jgi:microcystin-dependent protein